MIRLSILLTSLISTICFAQGITHVHGKVGTLPGSTEPLYSQTWFEGAGFGLVQLGLDKLIQEPHAFKFTAEIGKGKDFSFLSIKLPADCAVSIGNSTLSNVSMSSIVFNFKGESCENTVKSFTIQQISFEVLNVPVDGTGVVEKLQFSIDPQ